MCFRQLFGLASDRGVLFLDATTMIAISSFQSLRSYAIDISISVSWGVG